MFKVFFTKSFSKELKKLEKLDGERIKEKLSKSRENPLLFFEKLEGFELFRIRVGKYRVVSSINFYSKKITCVSVGLRKNIYRKLKK